MSIRIFEGSDHANLYAKFRPVVPQQVLDSIFSFLAERIDSENWNISVDVGCGSGQCANAISNYFKSVYGFDVSRAQIEEANRNQHPINVFYNVSPAETLPLIESNSAQLITASTAAHWFDHQRFFEEVNRILSPNGVVALFSFWFPRIIDPEQPYDENLANLMIDVTNDPNLVPYINPNLFLVENHYKDIKFPDNFEYVLKEDVTVEAETCAQQLVGYVQSLSYYQAFYQNYRIEAEIFIANLEQRLRDLLRVNDLTEKKVLCRYPYFIAMGRKRD